MVTNSWVQNNNGYKLHEKEWKYTFFSHNLPCPQCYAAVIFQPQQNMENCTPGSNILALFGPHH
jgi:hypothetical protein